MGMFRPSGFKARFHCGVVKIHLHHNLKWCVTRLTKAANFSTPISNDKDSSIQKVWFEVEARTDNIAPTVQFFRDTEGLSWLKHRQSSIASPSLTPLAVNQYRKHREDLPYMNKLVLLLLRPSERYAQPFTLSTMFFAKRNYRLLHFQKPRRWQISHVILVAP